MPWMTWEFVTTWLSSHTKPLPWMEPTEPSSPLMVAAWAGAGSFEIETTPGVVLSNSLVACFSS